MGQKTHPRGFRLILTEKHLSQWYSEKKNYSIFLKEDYFVREELTSTFNSLLNLSKIRITRFQKEKKEEKETVLITLVTLFPREKDMSRKIIRRFSSLDLGKPSLPTSKKFSLNYKNLDVPNIKKSTIFLLQRIIRKVIRLLEQKMNKKYLIKLKFIKDPFEDARFIAKYIAEQLEKRTPFRRVLNEILKKVQSAKIKGIKIQLSGRLTGAEMARTEWQLKGCVPLHTLKAHIDFARHESKSINGITGIKIWLFKKIYEKIDIKSKTYKIKKC